MAPQIRKVRPPLVASVSVLGLYFRGALFLFLSQLVCYSLGFALAGLPLWPVMALGCALLSLIPRIGSVIGIFLVLSISWISGVNWIQLAVAAGAWIAIEAIEFFWLAPKFLGKPLGLKAIVVFAVLLIAGFFTGPVGLILAVPALAVAMVWVRFFRGKPLLPK